MNLRKNLSPLLYILFSVLGLFVLFAGLRLFEMLLHRKYLFDYTFSDIFIRFVYISTTEFIFFLLFNSLYMVFYFCCEWLKKDNKFLFRKIFFYVLYLPLIFLFFLDMQTFAVQGQLFRLPLLSAFTVEMLINSWVFAIDYWYLIAVFLTASFFLFRFLPVIHKKAIPKKAILPSFLIYAGFSLSLLYLFTFAVFKHFPAQSEYRLQRPVN